MLTDESPSRIKIVVSGIVQGVGFRPFVYNLAYRHSLSGYVLNNCGSVEIEVQGASQSVANFIDNIKTEAPPLSLIQKVWTQTMVPCLAIGSKEHFEIRQSTQNNDSRRLVPPDTATCNDCVKELFDPHNRRYRYPFINCTNCGPRFTIMLSLPYDRLATTMASFVMCHQCRQEYDTPSDRRFHAQPNACAQCGPTLEWKDHRSTSRKIQGELALRSALDALRESCIVAAKGLGGFHLLCDAQDESAVRKLRQRKLRYRKPLAVMMSDVEMVRRYCLLSQEEESLLTSAQRPIVLLGKHTDKVLADGLAPGNHQLGVMLPYTPLHHLLMRDYGKPLVATSANLSEEPIAINNDEAIVRLSDIADGFLLHDRKIQSRYDDSVVKFVAGNTVLRRSRGLAPVPIQLSFAGRSTALGCGAHLKNTFCLVKEDQAFVSQHIGDLDNIETFEHLQESLSVYRRLFDIEPQLIAHDLHPDYLSTSFAQSLAREAGLQVVAVQHHHAHIVSCMAEHGLVGPVIGVAFDGLGYGADGTLWGGEFILSTFKEFTRVAHLATVPMPGGTQAIKQPWRMSLGYLAGNGNDGCFAPYIRKLEQRYGRTSVSTVSTAITKSLNCPLTSSCGRLFDAVSALLDICSEAAYEGQAAIELEATASRLPNLGQGTALRVEAYDYSIDYERSPCVIQSFPIIACCYQDWVSGVAPEIIATRFHKTICQIVVDVCLKLRQRYSINTVCLGGGVFQNALVLRWSLELLRLAGFEVFFAQQLPSNDGGLSLGQAVVALASADAINYDELRCS